ncbi:hypothetical protein GTP45_14370 [Pseudoduganella sp. FT55W]|uniref:Uncharacterized protein n=1 Tax=Duganella rivi TaxID=2666083 RepID=A0A7X4GQY5_9BURK|nr:hypothetical protein [Duganella rivi]MYM68006.1 hypothetical protein [Duganella rivi]
MKRILLVLLFIGTMVGAEAQQPEGSTSFEITVQNAPLRESTVVTIPMYGESQSIGLGGLTVEVSAPDGSDGPSVVKLFSANKQKPELLHTARIDNPRALPAKIAYTVCGKVVTFQSPAPAKLVECASTP